MDLEVRLSHLQLRSGRVLERSSQSVGAWALGHRRELVAGKGALSWAQSDQASCKAVRRRLVEVGQLAKPREQLGLVNSWQRRCRPWGRTSE